MDTKALQRTIARGIYELGVEDSFAILVARNQEPQWTGSLRNHRRRVWQALADNNPRNFDASWVLLAQRLFAYHDRLDLCDELVGALLRAQWEGQREREEHPERPMRKVRVQAVRREGAA